MKLIFFILFTTLISGQSLLLFDSPVLGGELLGNNGFEVDDNWGDLNLEGGETVEQSSTKVRSGSFSWYINVDGNSEGIVSTTNSFVIEDTKVYRISCYVWVISGSAVLYRNNSVDFEPDLSQSTSITGGWVLLTQDVTASKDNATTLIRIQSYGGAAEFYVDDATVREVL